MAGETLVIGHHATLRFRCVNKSLQSLAGERILRWMSRVRLTLDDRKLIASGLREGLDYAEIARRLGRPTSTITREVARNGGAHDYGPETAHEAARRRAARGTSPRRDRAAVPAHGRDPAAVRRFVDEFSALMTQTGVPRMPSRVLSCLFATDSGQLTAGEIAAFLKVSPASVSKAVGYLEGLGLLRRERIADSKRERYCVDDDVWIKAWAVSADTNAQWAAAAADGARTLGSDTSAGVRVAQMGRFFAQLGDDMAGVAPLTGAADDAITLLALALQTGAAPTPEELAAVLAWPLPRVDAAIAAADGRLTSAQRRRLDRVKRRGGAGSSASAPTEPPRRPGAVPRDALDTGTRSD